VLRGGRRTHDVERPKVISAKVKSRCASKDLHVQNRLYTYELKTIVNIPINQKIRM